MSQVGRLLIETITEADPAVRIARARAGAQASLAEKLEACRELEQFRRTRTNLYGAFALLFLMRFTDTRSRKTRRSAARGLSRFRASRT